MALTSGRTACTVGGKLTALRIGYVFPAATGGGGGGGGGLVCGSQMLP